MLQDWKWLTPPQGQTKPLVRSKAVHWTSRQIGRLFFHCANEADWTICASIQSDLTASISEETLSVQSYGDFPDFDDCASTATTIPAVKSWYSDIDEDNDRVLCTHFLPDAAINLAPYAESIVDEDDINNYAPPVEIVTDEDTDVSPASSIEIVIVNGENRNNFRTSYENEEVEEISTPDSNKETLLVWILKVFFF